MLYEVITEAVLIDFSVRSGAENHSSGSNNTDAEKESSSTEKLLVQNFENSEFVHSDGQADNKSEAATDKINNLFKNPFNNGFGEKDGDNDNVITSYSIHYTKLYDLCFHQVSR